MLRSFRTGRVFSIVLFLLLLLFSFTLLGIHEWTGVRDVHFDLVAQVHAFVESAFELLGLVI